MWFFEKKNSFLIFCFIIFFVGLLHAEDKSQAGVSEKENHCNDDKDKTEVSVCKCRESDQNLTKPRSLFDINPMFGDRKHRINLTYMQDFDLNGFSGLRGIGFDYSQPNTFFSLAGRINLELESFSGISQLTELSFGISQDIALPLFLDNLYLGVGIGIYIRTQADERIGSNFNFGEKIFLGYRFKDAWKSGDMELELFLKHYSNGALTFPNGGYNFFGIGMAVLLGPPSPEKLELHKEAI